MKAAMYAIIKKDFRIVTSNRRLFSALLIVPLVLTIVLPSIFVITIHFVPDDPDITKLLSLLPETARMESLELTLSGMILNYILPVFFLIIPIMTASIMAASAFVGEKERHTLETLLYCPLTLKQIFKYPKIVTFRGHLGFTMILSTKVRRRRNGNDPDLDFESGAADRPARCPCAGVPAMAGPAHPLDGCLDCSL